MNPTFINLFVSSEMDFHLFLSIFFLPNKSERGHNIYPIRNHPILMPGISNGLKAKFYF